MADPFVIVVDEAICPAIRTSGAVRKDAAFGIHHQGAPCEQRAGRYGGTCLGEDVHFSSFRDWAEPKVMMGAEAGRPASRAEVSGACDSISCRTSHRRISTSCLVRAARAVLRLALIGRNKRPTTVFAYCPESRHLVSMRANRPHLAELIDAIAAPLTASSFFIAVAALCPTSRAFEIDPDEDD
jgi:hypothetical protein